MKKCWPQRDNLGGDVSEKIATRPQCTKIIKSIPNLAWGAERLRRRRPVLHPQRPSRSGKLSMPACPPVSALPPRGQDHYPHVAQAMNSFPLQPAPRHLLTINRGQTKRIIRVPERRAEFWICWDFVEILLLKKKMTTMGTLDLQEIIHAPLF